MLKFTIMQVLAWQILLVYLVKDLELLLQKLQQPVTWFSPPLSPLSSYDHFLLSHSSSMTFIFKKIILWCVVFIFGTSYIKLTIWCIFLVWKRNLFCWHGQQKCSVLLYWSKESCWPNALEWSCPGGDLWAQEGKGMCLHFWFDFQRVDREILSESLDDWNDISFV